MCGRSNLHLHGLLEQPLFCETKLDFLLKFVRSHVINHWEIMCMYLEPIFCPLFWGKKNSTLQKKAFKFQSKTRGQLGYKYIYIYIHSYIYIYLSTGCRGFLRVLSFGGHTFLPACAFRFHVYGYLILVCRLYIHIFLRTCCIKITVFCTMFFLVLRRFVY